MPPKRQDKRGRGDEVAAIPPTFQPTAALQPLRIRFRTEPEGVLGGDLPVLDEASVVDATPIEIPLDGAMSPSRSGPSSTVGWHGSLPKGRLQLPNGSFVTVTGVVNVIVHTPAASAA